METNVTSPQSEPDQDNSSLQNPSTNPAEAGTTDETRDEDHETSSIEALNWSEVEEEELAAAQQAEALAAAAALTASKGNVIPEAKVDSKDEESTSNNNGSSTGGSSTVLVNEEGNVLSTSLLQSINSSASDEDPQARKLSVIENWASEVTNAVERGEIEMEEDFPDENGAKEGDDQEDDNETMGEGETTEGVRKRKGKLSPEMVSSMMSTASNGDPGTDPLSNAPVLDDGPIWDKGPRTYTFQENRGINQKLTLCLLIAVVLAIGLGLGNLVAHQECEADYKSSQQSHSNLKPTEKSPVHAGTIPTTTTPSPIIPDRSTDSTPPPTKPAFLSESNKQFDDDTVTDDDNDMQNSFKPIVTPSQEKPFERESDQERIIRKRRDEPIIDPKYKAHAETLSKVVNTLDRLSQKIDKFENNTRKLQGVLMIPDEENEEVDVDSIPPIEKPSLYDEKIHKDDEYLDKEFSWDDTDEEENEEAIIADLIDAIEQTPDYVEMKREEKRWEEFDKQRHRSKIFDRKDTPTEEELDHIKIIEKTVLQFKEFERRFVKSERKRLREEGKYHRLTWRLPEEYTVEEKNALRVRYKTSWQEFLKLVKNKVPDPIQAFFGDEEEEEERTMADVFHFPFPDPEDDLSYEETEAFVMKNFEEAERDRDRKRLSKEEKKEEPLPEVVKEESDTETKLEDVSNVQPDIMDDLIVLETVEKPEEAKVTGENEKPQGEESEDISPGKFESLEPLVKAESRVPITKTASSPVPTSDAAVSDSKELNANKNRLSSVKAKVVKRDVDSSKTKPSSLKSKKSKSQATQTNEVNSGKRTTQTGQTDNVKVGGSKRDQKQKEQAKGRQGKQKSNSKMSNGNVNAGNNKDSMPNQRDGNGKSPSKSSKRVKNAESNKKVFENVKGKIIERRRVPAEGKENQFVDAKKSSSGSTRESTNDRGDNLNVPNGNGKNKYRPNANRNNNNKNGQNHNEVNQQQKNTANKKQYDAKGTAQQRREQYAAREKRNGNAQHDKLKMKYDSQDLSSNEVKYRQYHQTPEANINYGGRPQAQNDPGKTYNPTGKKLNRSQEKTGGKFRPRGN